VLRVAVIATIRDFPWGAPGHTVGALVKELSERGHRVLWVVAPIDADRPEVKALAALGVEVRPLPGVPPTYLRFAKVRESFRRRFSSEPDLESLVAAFRPDHIFVNLGDVWSGMDRALRHFLAPHAGKYSLICHSNSLRPPFGPSDLEVARGLLNSARRVFFNSDWTHALAELQIAQSIPNWAIFQPPLRRRIVAPLAWPKNERATLAMVNRLDSYTKGIDIAFQAVAALRSDGIPIRLQIYGDGQERAYLGALSAYLKVEDSVEFHGYTDDLEKLWSVAEGLLLPSRFEGLAVSMLEAMGYGRIVLRTPYGGAAEWVEDGVNGYICPAAEASLLHQSLRRAISERSRWREMGLRAHEKFQGLRAADPAGVFFESLA